MGNFVANVLVHIFFVYFFGPFFTYFFFLATLVTAKEKPHRKVVYYRWS